MAAKDKVRELRTTLVKAIRSKCLECSGTQAEVELCEVQDCPLWEYRLGGKQWEQIKSEAM